MLSLNPSKCDRHRDSVFGNQEGFKQHGGQCGYCGEMACTKCTLKATCDSIANLARAASMSDAKAKLKAPLQAKVAKENKVEAF